jgi:hypothetical protein
MMARHCYGTTGARMYLDVRAEDHVMGQAFEGEGPMRIAGIVHGTAPIESITLFNRSVELKRFQPNPQTRDSNRVRIIWSGATHQDRGRFMKWDGGLEISGGAIKGASPLNIYTAKYGIDDWGDHHVRWRSVTSGQEEGVMLDIDAPDDAKVTFKAGPANLSFTLEEVRANDLRWDLGGLEQYVAASTLHTDNGACDAEFEYVDEKPADGEQAYWVRVVQTDFHRAWSSPIYVDPKKR